MSIEMFLGGTLVILGSTVIVVGISELIEIYKEDR